MEAGARVTPRLRVASSEVDSGDVSTRVLLPGPQQTTWEPFRRVAETVARPRMKAGKHLHVREEVLVYVLEGAALHEVESGGRERLEQGSVAFLTSPGSAVHAVTLEKGRTARWFSAVVGLGGRADGGPVRVQHAAVDPGVPGPEGTVSRPVVGGSSGVRSASGLDCSDLEFVERGTYFQRIGRDRRGVIYVLAGSALVDNRPIEIGSGGFVENASGLAVAGEPGFRAIVATAPAPSLARGGSTPTGITVGSRPPAG